jgi:plastocyanin
VTRGDDAPDRSPWTDEPRAAAMRGARLAALAAAAMIAIAACASSSTPAPSVSPSVASSPATSPAGSAATGVAIAGFSFQPATITIPVGTTVEWTNSDSTGHTVTADDGSFKSDRLGSGATFSRTFATAGTFAYHCSIHPSMTGTIIVQ